MAIFRWEQPPGCERIVKTIATIVYDHATDSSLFVDDSIPPIVLGLVEAVVGAFDHLFGFGGVEVFGVGGDSGADGDFDGTAIDSEFVFFDVLAESFAEDGGPFA